MSPSTMPKVMSNPQRLTLLWLQAAEISVLSFINAMLLILDLRTKVLTYDVIYDLFNKDYTI